MIESSQENLLPPGELISAAEAAHILGFKQTLPVMKYVKKGYLKAYPNERNNRKLFLKEEILSFPRPLPIPPPSEKFKGHGRKT